LINSSSPWLYRYRGPLIKKSKKMSTGLIAGVAAAGAVLLIALAILACFCIRRRRTAATVDEHHQQPGATTTPAPSSMMQQQQQQPSNVGSPVMSVRTIGSGGGPNNAGIGLGGIAPGAAGMGDNRMSEAYQHSRVDSNFSTMLAPFTIPSQRQSSQNPFEPPSQQGSSPWQQQQQQQQYQQQREQAPSMRSSHSRQTSSATTTQAPYGRTASWHERQQSASSGGSLYPSSVVGMGGYPSSQPFPQMRNSNIVPNDPNPFQQQPYPRPQHATQYSNGGDSQDPFRG
jgi:hypothetical protein